MEVLTPMLVQYVVALCCLRANPDAVDVTVGDMVRDAAAEKDRDVDITVTMKEPNGSVSAFKAYEVKREGGALDVAAVEQLCMKFNDMPAVTHRAVVSASGFTAPAIKKANAHSVSLYTMLPWTKPIAEQFPEFDGVGKPEDFLQRFESNLLYWVDSKLHLVAPLGPSSFTYGNAEQIFSADGSVHPVYKTFGAFREALLLRSTEILFAIEPAQTVSRTFPYAPLASGSVMEGSPAWPHTHTIDVTRDQVHLKLKERSVQLTTVTVSGHLQWQRKSQDIEFHILEDATTREAFAAAALAEWGTPDGRMFAMVFAPGSRSVGIHTIELNDEHRNMIRRLKVPLHVDT